MMRRAAVAALLALFSVVEAQIEDYRDYAFGTVLREQLTLGEYFSIKTTVPPDAQALKVAVVPIYGDTDAYLAVNKPFASPNDASWRMDRSGMEEMILRRESVDFGCEEGDPCQLFVKLFGFSTTEFLFAVTNMTDPTVQDPSALECAPGCNHFDLTDNECHEECNTTKCLYDGGDCLVQEEYCSRGCPSVWIGDGICDDACFVMDCDWDGGDCFDDTWEDYDETPSGCAPGCLPGWIDDNQCDPECNVPACQYDGDDCFFGHDECYFMPDGSDYRGNVNRTKSGKTCQFWSSQYPQQHTRTVNFYPWAGLGGHNYCRNPDGEESPWCYTTDPQVRWELCDIQKDDKQCTERGPEPRTDRGEVAAGPQGKCPEDMFLRTRGVCAQCTKCDVGMEERIACSTDSNRVCAPACALDAANRFVAEGQGAIGVVQSLCGYDQWDHNASNNYASWNAQKLCGPNCCSSYGLAVDACDYDGVHKDTWNEVKTELANAYDAVCPNMKTHDCRSIQVALIETKGTKLSNVTQILSRPRTPLKITTSQAIHNPFVVTVMTALGAGSLVLGLGLCWYRRRVKATLLYASPNAPDEVQQEEENRPAA